MPGDLTVIKPTEPVLTRKRQELTIQTASAALATADWYQLYLEVPQTGLDDAVYYKTPNASDDATFQIDELLDSQLDYQLPAFDLSGVVEDNSVLKLITVTVAERYFEGTEIGNDYSENIWALKAGLGHRLNAYDFHADFIAGNRFLAFTGRGQRVNKETPLFLSFYTENGGSVFFKVRATVTYANGSTQTQVTNYEDLAPPRPKQVFIIASGFEQLGLSALAPTQTPVSVSITLLNNSDIPISEVFSYKLQTHKAKRSFLFANSAGGWSTLCCFGNATVEAEVERETVERNLAANHMVADRQFRSLPKPASHNQLVETSYLTEAERLHTLELFRSPEIYEIGSASFLPIRLTSSSIKLSDTYEQLYSSRIEYEDAFVSKVYDGKILW